MTLSLLSDRLQEYKQRHMERKAAAARELGFKISTEPATLDTVSVGEKSSDNETGCEMEVEDGGNGVVVHNSESQQEQSADVTSDQKDAISANGHGVKPAEQSTHEEKSNVDSDGAASDVEVKRVNEDEMTSGSEEKTSDMNGAVDIIASPSVVKSSLTWADVVGSKATNGTGSKAVNGAAEE